MPDYGQLQIGSIGSLDTTTFLLLAAVLFILGTVGVLVRRNPIVILVCIELMLNAVNLTLITFARQLHNLEGQLFVLMTMVVAAAEAVVGLAVWLLLPWIERTPAPLLAAIVIHAVGHTLNPAALRPYFAWRRDRLIVVLAFFAVLALGVLDGLLLAIAASLLMLLQTLSRSHVSWLGRLGDTHDFVDAARHPDAVVPAGLLIARPEAPLFFGNADPVFAAIRERLQSLPSPRGVVLSLEDSADLDATSVEALCDFAAQLRQLGVPLALARVKDPVRDLLARVGNPALPRASYAGWSVDDAVRQLQIPA